MVIGVISVIRKLLLVVVLLITIPAFSQEPVIRKIMEFNLGSPIYNQAAFEQNHICVATGNGRIISIRPDNYRLEWKTQFDEKVTATPVFTDKHLIIGSYTGTIRAIELKSGKISWLFSAFGKIYEKAVFNEDKIFFGSDSNYVYALNHAVSQFHLERIKKFPTPINAP